MDKSAPYYAQFDNDEIDGKFYPLGTEIPDTIHAGVKAVLVAQGRIGTTKPAAFSIPLADTDAPVANMTRAELERSVLAISAARITDASDEELRSAVNSSRGGEPAPVETGADVTAYDDIKDKPLNTLKTADLVLIAEHENASLDGANTNPDRVKAIEAARKAKQTG